MGPSIIARNYAETLLTLGERHGGDATVDAFGASLRQVVSMLEGEPRLREFLETPRIDAEGKKRALRAALGGRAPDLFLRFLLVVVEKRRQGLLPEIADEYEALVDVLRGRVRAEITLPGEADEAMRQEVVGTLETRLGKKVVPTFRTDPSILGGVVIRVGERTLDGSLRRQITGLRRRLLQTRLPAVAAS